MLGVCLEEAHSLLELCVDFLSFCNIGCVCLYGVVDTLDRVAVGKAEVRSDALLGWPVAWLLKLVLERHGLTESVAFDAVEDTLLLASIGRVPYDMLA